MTFYTRMLKQKAIYWKKVDGSEDAFGNPSYDGPAPIACRWKDVIEQFIAPDGTTQLSKSVVLGDRYMYVGDLLLLVPDYSGTVGGPLGPAGNAISIATHGYFISDVASPTDPLMEDYNVDDPKKELGAWEIKAFASIPEIRARWFVQKAWL